MTEKYNRDNTKYVVVQTGFLSRSGYPEIVAAFEFKKDAMAWVRTKYGSNWRRDYKVWER